MCAGFEVGDNNVARSVLPDATVTAALVGSFPLSCVPDTPSDLVLLLSLKVRGIPVDIAKRLYEACTEPKAQRWERESVSLGGCTQTTTSL